MLTSPLSQPSLHEAPMAGGCTADFSIKGFPGAQRGLSELPGEWLSSCQGQVEGVWAKIGVWMAFWLQLQFHTKAS